RKGRGKEALYYAILASVFGGLCGVAVLIFFTPLLASVALQFGPPEMFLIAVAGLAVVGSLSGKGIGKGFFAVLFGVLLSMIGVDTLTGQSRLTFGIPQLTSGIGLIPAIVGFFALSEMVCQCAKIGEKGSKTVSLEKIRLVEAIRRLFKHWFLLIKSTLIGIWIGILPGTGGAISAFVSYGEAKRGYKEGEVPFGEGNEKGIIAAESSNNAAVGGSLIPLLALGIPGSATAAIIYGAILIHGITPGPKLFIDAPELAYSFTIGMLFAVLAMGVIGICGVPLFSKILKIKIQYIVPIVIVCSLIGAYSSRNSIYDVVIAVVCGLIGVLFHRCGIPVAPVMLGLILGNLVEVNLRNSMLIAAAKDVNLLQYIFTRPLSIAVVVLLALMLFGNIKTSLRSKNTEE
ncbi:MAG: tripartite tricarboxylate transporter permease, partial [Ruthenibacterium sp.]